MQRTSRSAWMIAGLVLGSDLAVAQTAREEPRCATIVDDGERLACYDAIFGAPGGNPAAQPVRGAAEAGGATAARNATASKPAAGTARDEFGLTEADIRARDPVQAEADNPSSISGRVAEARRNPDGTWVVRLENGQVWVQLDSRTHAVLKAGDGITIRRAALGSYILVSAQRVAMRVRRVE